VIVYFSLENNKTKTYLHLNDILSICKKDDSPPLSYSILFFYFDNSGKEKLLSSLMSKNLFVFEKSKSLSDLVLNNPLFNFLFNLLHKNNFTPSVFISSLQAKTSITTSSFRYSFLFFIYFS
jgi:hypothetical protein